MEPEQTTQIRRGITCLLVEKMIHEAANLPATEHMPIIQGGPALCSSQFFLVMLDNALPFSASAAPEPLTPTRSELGLMIESVFEPILSVRYLFLPFRSAGKTFLLLNLKTPLPGSDTRAASNALSLLRADCDDCVRLAAAQSGMQLHAYISRLIRDIRDLELEVQKLLDRASIRTAERLEQRVVSCVDCNNIHLRANIQMRRESKLLQTQVLEYVDQHQFDRAIRTILQLIRHDWENYSLALTLRKRLTGLVYLLYSWPEFPCSADDLTGNSIADRISRCATRAELEACVTGLFSRFDELCRQHPLRKVDLMDDIIDHIEANYADPMLSVSSISELFGIGLSYLSRLFHQVQGTRLIDYIHNVRLHHAKQRLAASNDTLDAIAAQVGYPNAISLSRAFKRYENVTPGAYRKMVRQAK